MMRSIAAASATGCLPMRVLVVISRERTGIMRLQNPKESWVRKAYRPAVEFVSKTRSDAHATCARVTFLTRKSKLLATNPTKARPAGLKKLRPALGGGLAARDPVWDGEGWGCDRVAGSIIPLVLAVAGAGGGHRRPAVTERDPDIGIALRLPLDEAVAGLGPGQDVFVLVVENELALVGLHRQHRVAFALLVAHDGDEESLARPSGIDQHLALQQHVVFAVTVTVR